MQILDVHPDVHIDVLCMCMHMLHIHVHVPMCMCMWTSDRRESWRADYSTPGAGSAGRSLGGVGKELSVYLSVLELCVRVCGRQARRCAPRNLIERATAFRLRELNCSRGASASSEVPLRRMVRRCNSSVVV